MGGHTRLLTRRLDAVLSRFGGHRASTLPPIVLNTMPKSRSVYILGTLASSLSIERFFVGSVKWLQEWLHYQKSGGPIAVLVTTHDDLVADERAFFDRILNFFDIPDSRFRWRPEDKTIENH